MDVCRGYHNFLATCMDVCMDYHDFHASCVDVCRGYHNLHNFVAQWTDLQCWLTLPWIDESLVRRYRHCYAPTRYQRLRQLHGLCRNQ